MINVDEYLKEKEKQEQEKRNFDMSEEEDSIKKVITVYGEKGTGKTTSVFSFKGKKVCISFDHKSTLIKNNFYNGSKDIRVYDGLRYYDESIKEITKSSVITYEYLKDLIEKQYSKPENYPDWIIVDGLEIVAVICEMIMRNNHNLGPFEAFANFGYWKERKILMNNLHSIYLKHCKKGIIYTTYTKDDQVIFNSEVTQSKKIPKWFGSVLEQTDIVLKTGVIDMGENKFKFKVLCESSKFDDEIKTGQSYLVTKDGLVED